MLSMFKRKSNTQKDSSKSITKPNTKSVSVVKEKPPTSNSKNIAKPVAVVDNDSLDNDIESNLYDDELDDGGLDDNGLDDDNLSSNLASHINGNDNDGDGDDGDGDDNDDDIDNDDSDGNDYSNDDGNDEDPDGDLNANFEGLDNISHTSHPGRSSHSRHEPDIPSDDMSKILQDIQDAELALAIKNSIESNSKRMALINDDMSIILQQIHESEIKAAKEKEDRDLQTALEAISIQESLTYNFTPSSRSNTKGERVANRVVNSVVNRAEKIDNINMIVVSSNVGRVGRIVDGKADKASKLSKTSKPSKVNNKAVEIPSKLVVDNITVPTDEDSDAELDFEIEQYRKLKESIKARKLKKQQSITSQSRT